MCICKKIVFYALRAKISILESEKQSMKIRLL